MSRVLLTGATGFIGRHAGAALEARGHEVVAVSRATGHDLLEPGAARALVEEVRPTHLLHLAWYAEHGAFWTSEENLRWVEASLALLRAFDGERAVIAGTCAEYDWAHGYCVEGVTPLAPATLYGAAKHALHTIAAKQSRYSVAWGRIFFVHGPHEDPRRLVASVARALVRGEEAPTSLGTQRRDFLHAADLADAFAALLSSDVTGPVNLASGEPTTVREVVDEIARAAGRPELLRVGAVPMRSDDPPMLVADVRRLRDEVGWRPARTLREGIEENRRVVEGAAVILVTGGQGFIGSWLVSRLLAEGRRVAVLDRPARPGSRFELERLAAEVRAVPAELGDRAALDGVDTVFHLAARTLVAEAERDPAGTYEVNVGGTWRLLDACAQAGVARVVLVSSYLGYGRGEVYREDMPLRPSTAYGTSNAAADLIARSYADRVPVGIVRLGNVYGGGDVHYSRIVPDAVRALAEGRRPVIRSDGTPRRDFLYVEDAVDACLAVAGALPEQRGEAFNAGAGEAVAILDLVRTLARVAGREDLEPDVRGAPGPPDRQVLDTTKIRETLGWTPRHGLEEGLARTWAWYRERAGVAA